MKTSTRILRRLREGRITVEQLAKDIEDLLDLSVIAQNSQDFALLIKIRKRYE